MFDILLLFEDSLLGVDAVGRLELFEVGCTVGLLLDSGDLFRCMLLGSDRRMVL